MEDFSIISTQPYQVAQPIELQSTEPENFDGLAEKFWECKFCWKRFTHQYTLQRHLPVHTDERRFKCPHCPKKFRQLSTLYQHKATHSDARPYVCDVCSKSFNRCSTLSSHRETHSNNFKHVCSVCKKGFHQKGNLRNHMFTHCNERPYKCDQCDKGFNQKSNLVCHKKSIHKERDTEIICPICSKTFKRVNTFRAHLTLHEEMKTVLINTDKNHNSITPATRAGPSHSYHRTHILQPTPIYSPAQPSSSPKLVVRVSNECVKICVKPKRRNVLHIPSVENSGSDVVRFLETASYATLSIPSTSTTTSSCVTLPIEPTSPELHPVKPDPDLVETLPISPFPGSSHLRISSQCQINTQELNEELTPKVEDEDDLLCGGLLDANFDLFDDFEDIY